MFSELFELYDELDMRERYDKAERKRNFAEGMEKGKSDAINSIADKLREMGLSDEQIKKATSI